VNPDSDRRFAAFRDAHVMITGGVGLIGSALARRLAALGAEVLLVDSMVGEAGANLANIADIRSGCGSTSPISATRPHCVTCCPARISCSTSPARPAISIR